MKVSSVALLALACMGSLWSSLADPEEQQVGREVPQSQEQPSEARYALLMRDGPALPRLMQAMHDTRPEVRAKAVVLLAAVDGPERMAALPALMPATHDPCAAVRRNAVKAIATFGPEAAHVAPMLRRCLNDADPQVRMFAALALKKLFGESGKAECIARAGGPARLVATDFAPDENLPATNDSRPLVVPNR